MILRRVIEHFGKQEWTAIFLDFVIVVIGVYAGMQESNRNAASRDQAHERLDKAGPGFGKVVRTDMRDARALTSRLRIRCEQAAALLTMLNDSGGAPARGELAS